jgi:hypothetical protein
MYSCTALTPMSGDAAADSLILGFLRAAKFLSHGDGAER